MKRLLSVLVTFLLLVPAEVFAKAETSKITIKGGDLRAPIEITNPKTLANFSVWTGLGTSCTGAGCPQTTARQAESFIVDWSQAVADPPSGLQRYEVSFYAKTPNERLIYVVFYEYDPATEHGYIYFPGRTEEWYRLNVSTIFHGVEVRARGDSALRHGLRGRLSNRKTPEAVKERAVELYREKKQAKLWHDYGPTLTVEELAEQHGITISRETLRKWLIEAKLWRVRRARVEQAHVWRARRARLGELVQWDTSEHDWLEGRGEKLYLIAMIDDATSQLMARFVRHDSTEENLCQLRSYVQQHGRPVAVYTDKASLFQITPRAIHHRDAPQQQLSQIGRALKELDIEWIAAHSPQAKGRIERAFQTAQDRLVKGLRQVGANDLQTANEYLQRVYVPLWNRRFRREPQLAGDAHRALAPGTNLDSVLSIRESRTVGQDHTLRWHGVIYRVEQKQIRAAMRGARVQVERRLDGSVWMHWRDQVLALELCQATPRVCVERPYIQGRAIQGKSAQEKARARQRVLDARRRCQESYARLPDRPLWQAMKNSSPQTERLL